MSPSHDHLGSHWSTETNMMEGRWIEESVWSALVWWKGALSQTLGTSYTLEACTLVECTIGTWRGKKISCVVEFNIVVNLNNKGSNNHNSGVSIFFYGSIFMAFFEGAQS